MPLENRNPQVDEFLEALEHPRLAEVQQLRLAILAAVPAITETIKWNAPSFRHAGEDRVTFRLRPRDQVQLVFHRGVRVREDQDSFRFADPSGLMEWLSPDRAVVTFAGPDETRAGLPAVTELVGRWVQV